MAAPFEFTEEQADHILDMTLGRLTRLGRTNLEEEMAKLRETIAELEAILADTAKLRGVIKTEMGEIRDKFANDRRADDHLRPRRHGRRGPDRRRGARRHHDPGRLHQGGVGRRRSAPRAAAAGASQGAKLKEEDLVAQVIHTTRPRLPAVLLQPRAGCTGCGPTRSR